jgi:hypothetical protein
MNYALACQGLMHALSLLSGITQVDNTTTSTPNRYIGWSGRKPGIQKNVYYPIEYQYLLDTQQYSVLLRDSSFFQFFFQFDASDKLSSARLAYYPRPVNTLHENDDLLKAADDALDRQDEELYNHLFNWVELLETDIGKPANTSHVRFDYDSKVLVHSKSHLQFGAIQEFRLPSNNFPLPIAFVELCSSIIAGTPQIPASHLVFARNHKLGLLSNEVLICLS